MQKNRSLRLLYCLKIISKIFVKIWEIINCGKILEVRKAIFSVKIYISLNGVKKYRDHMGVKKIPLQLYDIVNHKNMDFTTINSEFSGLHHIFFFILEYSG